MSKKNHKPFTVKQDKEFIFVSSGRDPVKVQVLKAPVEAEREKHPVQLLVQ